MNRALQTLVLIVLAIWIAQSAYAAAEPLPGDTCTAGEEDNFLRSGGKEIPTGHFIVCKSGTWRSILSWDAAAAVTKIGNLTCTNGQILKFNGTTWGCAADSGGTLPTLTSANIWVGNGSNAATAVAMSGDATMTNAGVLNLGAGVVTTTEILDATILAADLADDAVTIPKLAATGTPSATTYLRGDNTWATIGASLPALTSASIWVGNGSHVATAVAMSGDATMTNAGVLSLAANSVANAEMADDAVGLAELSATGTPSATTYLRGDNTWGTVSGDNLGAGGTTAGTLYSSNASGYGYMGSEGGTTGAYMRFDGDPAASAGRIYVNLLGTWEYLFHSDYFAPYATNVNDLGNSSVRWADGWFAGTVTAGTFAGSGASLTALNATNLASGTVPAARLPAYTGDVTKAAGGTVLTIAAGAVTATELASDAVTNAKVAADAIGIAELSATGTPGATTFLRGDNTWATAGGGGADPGTLCGIARKSGCDISCSDNTSPAYTSVSTCNGASVVSSCPSGYTLRTTAWTTMTSCGDSNSYLACMRNCSKN